MAAQLTMLSPLQDSKQIWTEQDVQRPEDQSPGPRGHPRLSLHHHRTHCGRHCRGVLTRRITGLIV